MNAQPILACGPDLSVLALIALAPLANFFITFVAGAVCCSMGNKSLGSPMMIGSFAAGAFCSLLLLG